MPINTKDDDEQKREREEEKKGGKGKKKGSHIALWIQCSHCFSFRLSAKAIYLYFEVDQIERGKRGKKKGGEKRERRARVCPLAISLRSSL